MKQLKAAPRRKAAPVRRATTLRLDPGVQEDLVLISKVLKAPLNRLVNEAVRAFVHQRTGEVVASMEKTLQLLKARKARDPEFKDAVTAFVDGEARLAKKDPAEGKVKQKRGRTQVKVRDLLNG
ncbi:MAG: hypothetical protein ABI771_14385 [Betaproteobacteria bacterium]